MTKRLAPMLGDGGIETDLIYHHGQDLPHFAAFVLLDTPEGREQLRRYYEPYVRIARDAGVGLVLETPTWRASPDWLDLLGRPVSDLARVNLEAVRLLTSLRNDTKRDRGDAQVVISGCVGPRTDGYDAGTAMNVPQARDYHAPQIEALRVAGADRVTAITMSYAAEAAGIASAAQLAGVPVVISFTVETDGHLPDGSSLEDAVRAVDDATDGGPAFFMVNCAHPSHIGRALGVDMEPDERVTAPPEGWRVRVRGVRANASTRSHAEMDAATDLDEGDPQVFGHQLARLRELVPSLDVLGGCCGTDDRHIRALAHSVTGYAV